MPCGKRAQDSAGGCLLLLFEASGTTEGSIFYGAEMKQRCEKLLVLVFCCLSLGDTSVFVVGAVDSDLEAVEWMKRRLIGFLD